MMSRVCRPAGRYLAKALPWPGIVLSLAVATGCSDTPTSATAVEETTSGSFRFSSMVTAGGASSRSFAARAGEVTATLASSSPAGLSLGLGLGIPRSDGTGCILTMAAVTTGGASPQLRAAVEAGQLCVQVYDAGTVANQAAFDVVVTVP